MADGKLTGGVIMLRHLISRQEVENRQNFPKNNYFCYRWRVKDHFNKSIERQMFHLAVHGAGNHKSLMNHKVLQLHKSRFTGNRRDLVVNLAQDAISFLDMRRMEHSKSSKEQVFYSTAMIDMVDMCFNLLLSCATELNTILGLSELFITATEPNFEVKDKTKETVCSFTQGRFSTSLFSLVIEGRREKIKFYIIPADELIAIEEVGLQYESIASWKARFGKDGRVIWMCQGMELSDEVLEVSAIQLLSQLIEKTKERLTPLEEQDKPKNEYALFEEDPWQKDVAIGYQNTLPPVETATTTGITAVTTSHQWNALKENAAIESRPQPPKNSAHNPLELQTLEVEALSDLSTLQEIKAVIKEEQVSKKQPRKAKKKLSRKKRKNQASK